MVDTRMTSLLINVKHNLQVSISSLPKYFGAGSVLLCHIYQKNLSSWYFFYAVIKLLVILRLLVHETLNIFFTSTITTTFLPFLLLNLLSEHSIWCLAVVVLEVNMQVCELELKIVNKTNVPSNFSRHNKFHLIPVLLQ